MKTLIQYPSHFQWLIFFATTGLNELSHAGPYEDAFYLADATPISLERVSPWRASTEASVVRTRQRFCLKDYSTARLSFDLY